MKFNNLVVFRIDFNFQIVFQDDICTTGCVKDNKPYYILNPAFANCIATGELRINLQDLLQFQCNEDDPNTA